VLVQDIERETRALTLAGQLSGAGAVLLSGWTWFTLRMNLFQQPKLLRLEYHTEKAGAGGSSYFRYFLQDAACAARRLRTNSASASSAGNAPAQVIPKMTRPWVEGRVAAPSFAPLR
jgi:hypothetical protein